MEANTSKVSENATAEKERNEAAKAGNGKCIITTYLLTDIYSKEVAKMSSD